MKRIIAIGGTYLSEDPLLEDYILSFVERERPKVCFLPTASGDSDAYVASFYRAFPSERCESSHLSLTERPDSIRDALIGQDVIYVGGGSTANLLALWRLHGLDQILKETWEQGTVLCGFSAGANCWFEASTTDSFGPTLQRLDDGLGFLEGSFCPHYDSEPQRRPSLLKCVAEGFPSGFAADDHVALHFVDQELVEVVASSVAGAAYRVGKTDSGAVEETEIAVTRL